MKRLLIISMFMLFSWGAIAQHINVGKGTQSISSGTVEISAAAIPISQAGNIGIDTAVYHKAIDNGINVDRYENIVEITAPAVSIVENEGGSPKKAEGKIDPMLKQPVSRTMNAVRVNSRAITK